MLSPPQIAHSGSKYEQHIAKWYGASSATIAKWRKALGVTRCNNLGTFKLICRK